MDHKQVTAAQIDQLYTFTRAHFVEYYDLQTELVDHLANAIETRWQKTPNLSFDDALALEFKKFGIYGFSDVVERRHGAMAKRYRKLMWGYFKKFITLPHIVLTLLLIVITYKILAYESLMLIPIVCVMIGVILFKTIMYRNEFNRRFKETGKKWYLEEMIYNCGGIAGMISVPFQFFNLVTNDYTSAGILWLLSVVIVIAGLLSYIVIFIIPGKAEEHLAAVYPEYVLEKKA